MEPFMSEQPLVTVCIPTYNRPDTLRHSLRSVLEQSYRHLEVIISDNASDTDTEAVVNSFADDRVRIDRLATNIGLHGNMTRGLHLGSGKYRTVLHDDDLMLPGNIDKKVEFFETHPQVGLVFSAFRLVDSDSQPHGPVLNWSGEGEDIVQPGPVYIREAIGRGGITCPPTVMLRSDVVADESFVVEDGPYCDLALWLRLALRTDVGFLPAPLSGYREHLSSASSGFQTIEQVRGRFISTLGHADALRLAVGRFLETADLDPGLRAECARLQRASDRRMRVAIRANRYLPQSVFQLAKRSVNLAEKTRILEAVSPLTRIRAKAS